MRQAVALHGFERFLVAGREQMHAGHPHFRGLIGHGLVVIPRAALDVLDDGDLAAIEREPRPAERAEEEPMLARRQRHDRRGADEEGPRAVHLHAAPVVFGGDRGEGERRLGVAVRLQCRHRGPRGVEPACILRRTAVIAAGGFRLHRLDLAGMLEDIHMHRTVWQIGGFQHGRRDDVGRWRRVGGSERCERQES